jgi:hypothetical protein
VFFVGENGSQIEHFLPSGNNGIVLQHVPYEHIQNGLQGSTVSGTTQVYIVIQSQKSQEPIIQQTALPPEAQEAILEKLGIEISLPSDIYAEGDFRDYVEVIV